MNKQIYIGMTADIMHPGLINIINEATKFGDVIVGLLTDKAIAEHKRLPYLTYEQRKKIVENIKGVSKVVPQEEWSYINNLKRLKPDYIIHGDDWKTGVLCEIREQVYDVMNKQGGTVIEIPYTQGINSSSLNRDIKSIGTTPDVRMKTLRRLINAKSIVRILEAHDGLCGLIIENLEIQKGDRLEVFDGMWSSSLTDSTSKGKPDIEAVDLTTRLQDLNNILECTTKPCNKIKAGKEAQVTNDFMIIARIESFIAGKSMCDALERAYAYVEAGADGIMIHSKNKSGEDIKEFCITFRQKYAHVPIVVVPTTYDHIYESELHTWGVNVVIYANHMLRAAYPAMLQVAKTILENERAKEVRPLCMPIKEILELIPGTK